jgi:hypothetical protein
MKVRFQADADLNQIIVSAVARRVMEIDFRTATASPPMLRSPSALAFTPPLMFVEVSRG